MIIISFAIGLFFVPQSPIEFVPSHTTVCPSIKYYSSFDEIINPVKKPSPSFVKTRKESAKAKRQNIHKENHKKRVLANKNRENAYMQKMMRNCDDAETNDKYLGYVENILQFYTHKYVCMYKAYIQNAVVESHPDTDSAILTALLKNEKLLLLKNRDYTFIHQRISTLIDRFDLLRDCIANSVFDDLSFGDMSKLKDGYNYYNR